MSIMMVSPYRTGSGDGSGGGGTPHAYWRILPLNNVFTWAKEIEFRGTFGGADQCDSVGGTAIAFDDDGSNPAANAFDNSGGTGSGGTQWKGATLKSWIGFHFSSAVDVAEVSFNSGTDAAHSPLNAIIQSSDDGSTWTDEWWWNVASWANNEIKVFERPIAGLAGYAWWRIYSSAAPNNTSAYEVEFRSSLGGSDLCDSVGGTGFAEDFGSPGFDGPAAFDNNGATQWISNGFDFPAWLRFHFNSDVSVLEVSFTCWLGARAPTAGSIQFSPDGIGWRAAYFFSGLSWTDGETKLIH